VASLAELERKRREETDILTAVLTSKYKQLGSFQSELLDYLTFL